MKNTKVKYSIYITLLAAALAFSTASAAEEQPSYCTLGQPETISTILSKENNIVHLKLAIELLKAIDDTYVDIYKNLNSGKKLIVFVDPAHGKLDNGAWEGEMTGRLSSTGLPEEYYSIMLSRELYRTLSANRFIEVRSTDDFMTVMKGKSDIYRNIPFVDTVRMATEAGAFIIVSEHLNNIASIVKASGLMNIPGVHITTDRWGNRYLSYVRDVHRGFLTLYNKYDATDFSRRYALNLKEALLARGMRANSWQFGAVPDDRFSYFVDFPISVIYESGFISNPEDEEFLRDPENQRLIVRGQYESLIETVREVFGVDISGGTPVRVGKAPDELIELLKLSRLVIFYITNCEAQKAIGVINLMEKKFAGVNPQFVAPYREIKNTLVRADSYFRQGMAHLKKKNYKSATWCLQRAKRTLRYRPLYSSLFARYSGQYQEMGVPGRAVDLFVYNPKKLPPATSRPTPPLVPVRSAALTTPIILAVDSDQTLENAVKKALSPDKKTLERLIKSFTNAYTFKSVKTGGKWRKLRQKVNFGPGIYIVRLDRNLNVVSVKPVKKVALIPAKFQNHQYLKNSYFALEHKERAL
ncbi:MAG TPA: N-acetylmuramoyl-L-alanine amidase [Spirochaetota bacterium]|nr:N-acetylmuramoyl-L-alanine amidase [Spirochaetota bacterium]